MMTRGVSLKGIQLSENRLVCFVLSSFFPRALKIVGKIIRLNKMKLMILHLLGGGWHTEAWCGLSVPRTELEPRATVVKVLNPNH